MGDPIGDIRDRVAANLGMLISLRFSRKMDFAAQVGLDPTNVGKYLSGDRTPSLPTAYYLAQHLDVTLDQLCMDQDELREELGI